MLLSRRPSQRSPIKDNPLRNPGQSLDEAINRLIDNDLSGCAVVFVFCVALTAYEWWRFYMPISLHPAFITVACSLIGTYALFRANKVGKEIKRLRMARDGERVVGQYLDLLREKGYQVFHDVAGDNFNIDHIIVGSRGIFTIETKTYSKPLEGKPTIHFDGDSVTVNGYKTPKPIVQASAQSQWLSEQIEQSTGHTHKVQPIVVFPGWFVTSQPGIMRDNRVWAINPKGLPTFVDNSAQRLSSEESKLVAYHLSRYIRSNNQSSHLIQTSLLQRICGDGTRR